jgi:prophage antirepressor-like protein
MKVEKWNGHEIRFVEKDGEWRAVAADVAAALNIKNISDHLSNFPAPYVAEGYIGVETGTKKDGTPAKQNVKVKLLSVKGIYRIVMRSNKPEAEAFQDWVCDVIDELRKVLGYEQYKIIAFIESAKNHHLNMDKLKEAFEPAEKKTYCKAHSVTNKCVANVLGLSKMIDKDALKVQYPAMIPLRDKILDDTVSLMALNDRFNLGLSISAEIYKKYVKYQ